MEVQDVKIFIPVIQIIFFFLFIFNRFKNTNNFFLFFISIILVISSNFTFYYREISKILSVFFVFYSLYFNKKRIIENYKFIKLSIYFLVFIIISIVKVENYQTYFNTLINFILQILIVFSIFLNIKNYISLKEMFKVMYLNALLQSIITIVLFFYFNDRIESSFTNPNYLAIYLSVGFVYALSLKGFLKFLVIFIFLSAIYFTDSRSILIMSFSILILNVIMNRNIFNQIIIFTLMIFSGIFLINNDFFSKIDNERYSKINEDASVLSRVEISKAAFEIGLSNPFTGIGYGQFQNNFKKFISDETLNTFEYVYYMDEMVTHNDFLRVFAELGLFALIYFVLVLIISIKNSFQLIKYRIYIPFYLFLMFVSFSFTHNNLNTFLFWFVIFLPIFNLKLLLNDKKIN